MRKCLSLFTLALTFSGCIFNSSGLRTEKSRLVVDNPAFASHFRMIEQIRRDTPEGFARVQVVVQNDDRSDTSFQYRFAWLDADGMALPECMPTWHHATVHGRDKIYLNGVSERTGAADFRVVMRNVRTNERW